MKLYFAPGACSLSVHIALEALGLPYDLERVDLRTHKTASGKDHYTINPKGYVPVLELDDGERLTEAAVVLQYVADRKPGTLAPAFGSMARYHLMEWLNYIATELHKRVGPLWIPKTGEEQRMSRCTRSAAASNTSRTRSRAARISPATRSPSRTSISSSS